jgi:hypothetical protein
MTKSCLTTKCAPATILGGGDAPESDHFFKEIIDDYVNYTRNQETMES